VVTEFLIALQFLSIIRLHEAVPFENNTLGRASAFFPAVGFFLGMIVWGLDSIYTFVFPHSLVNAFTVATLAWLSRGLHLDGLADTADGLLGSADRQRSLAIMKDSRIGTFGTLALLGVVLVKIRALDLLLSSNRTHALLLSPMFARWACVIMAYQAPPARSEGLGALLIRGVQFREVVLASVSALVIGVLTAGFFSVFLLTLLTGVTLAATRYCVYRLGGATGDTMGALGEIVEAAALCIFAATISNGERI